MGWQDDLTEAAYTSPSGERMVFLFDGELSRVTQIKSAKNTFPDFDGQEVQSLGLGGCEFSMTAVFLGASCFDDASHFENLLGERGKGVLEHPVYGKYTVVPTGSIERSDNLVDSANESRVKITFSQTLSDRAEDVSSKAVQSEMMNEAESLCECIVDAGVLELECVASGDDVISSLTKDGLNDSADDIEKTLVKESDLKKKKSLLQSLSDARDTVMEWLSTAKDWATEAENGVSAVEKGVRSAVLIARLPAKTGVDILAKIEGFSSAFYDILRNVEYDPLGINALKKQAISSKIMLEALLLGVFECVGSWSESDSSQRRKCRSDMIGAAVAVGEMFACYSGFVDALTRAKNVSLLSSHSFLDVSNVDSGEVYGRLLALCVDAVRVLQGEAANLSIAKKVRLGEDRQVLELLVQFYGAEGFSHFDEFVQDNDLSADELVCVPMGREIFYYG